MKKKVKPIEQVIIIFKTIMTLNFDSIRRYRDEKELHKYMQTLTNNKSLMFNEIIKEIYTYPKEMSRAFYEFYNMEVENPYLKKIIKTLKNRSLGLTQEESELENVEVNLSDLGIILFKERCFSSSTIDPQKDVILSAVKEDNIQMIKAFYTNCELNIEVRNYYNESLLHLAACENAVKIIDYFVLDLNMKIDDANDEGKTPLHQAINFESIDAAKRLIELGASVNISDENGSTPLHIACFHEQFDLIKILVKHKAKINIDSIYVLIRNDREDIIEYLIMNNKNILKNNDLYFWVAFHNALKVYDYLKQLGIKPNYKDEEGFTPLHLATHQNHIEMTKKLIEDECDMNESSDNGITPLHQAISTNAFEVTNYLIKIGTNLNAKTNEGLTGLHLAVQSKNIAILKCLLEHDVNINEKSKEYLTPLHMAVLNKNNEITKCLIENGADVNLCTDNNGASPLHDATYIGDKQICEFLIESGAMINLKSKTGITPLHNATLYNQLEICKLLIEKGADIECMDNEGITPLQVTAIKGYTEIGLLLIENGADVHVKSRRENTPLCNAIAKKHVELAKILIKYGSDVNAKNYNNIYPLHYATIIDNVELVELLIEKGAKIDCLDKKQLTPLHYAVIKNNVDIAWILINNGANIKNKPVFKSLLTYKTPILLALQKRNKKMVELFKTHPNYSLSKHVVLPVGVYYSVLLFVFILLLIQIIK